MYSLEFLNDGLTYLRDHQGLSRAGRIRLFVGIHENLRVNGDRHRHNPDNRLPDNPDLFRFDLLIFDEGRWFHFSFVVNDSAAEYGVLRIEYVEERIL